MARKRIAPGSVAREDASARAAYGAALDRLTEQATKKAWRKLGKIPAGSPATEAVLEELSAELEARTEAAARFARAAHRRTLETVRKELRRTLGGGARAKIPRDFAEHVFVERQLGLLRRAVADQTTLLRESLAKGEAGADLLSRMHLYRNRAKLIAHSETHNLFWQTFAERAAAEGSAGGWYFTARDDRVRPTHAANDRKFFTWGALPGTLYEPMCRCGISPQGG